MGKSYQNIFVGLYTLLSASIVFYLNSDLRINSPLWILVYFLYLLFSGNLFIPLIASKASYIKNPIYYSCFFAFVFYFSLISLSLLIISQFGFHINRNTFSILLLFWSIIGISNYKNMQSVVFEKRQHLKIDIVQILFLIPFLVLFGLAAIIACKQHNGSWDHFTFWWFNAKEIFLNQGFFKKPFGTIDTFGNSSFYPLFAVQLYLLFGRVVDQYAIFIPQAIGLVGVVSTISCLKKYGNGVLLSGVFYLFVLFSTMFGWLVTFYADIFSFCFVLMTALYVFGCDNRRGSLFILLFSMFCLTQIKIDYSYFLPFLILPLLIKNLPHKIKNLFSTKTIGLYFGGKKSFLLLLILIVVTIISRFYDAEFISREIRPTILANPFTFSFDNIYFKFKHFNECVKYVFSIFYLVATVFILSLLYQFSMASNMRRGFGLCAFFVLVAPILMVMMYTLQEIPLQSKSLHRYVTLTLPCGALLFIYFSKNNTIHSSIKRISVTFFSIIFFSYTLLALFNHQRIYSTILANKYHNGSYPGDIKVDMMKTFRSLTRGFEDKMYILAVNQKNGSYGNRGIDSIKIRYNLLDILPKWSSCLYNTKESHFLSFIDQTKAEAVILINPSQELLQKIEDKIVRNVKDMYLYFPSR